MKRKPSKRKTAKKKPAMSAKPLRELGGELLKRLPSRPDLGMVFWFGEGPQPPRKPRTEIAGAPLPPDLEPAVRYYAGNMFDSVEQDLTRPPWEWGPGTDGEEESEEDYPGWKRADILPEGWYRIRQTLEDCFRQGFYLALLRYADDLKTSAEAEPLIEGLRQAARKGGAARRAQAAPIHKAIRKRFRELRKTTPKKTVRYLRVAEEFEMSDRQVARIVDGID